MTREEILAMQAGRELDALVATNVMSLCVLDSVQMYGDGCVMSDKGFDEWEKHPMFGKTDDPDFLQPYSTDISATWEVVEKFEDYGVVKSPTRGHYCFIQTTKKTYQSPSCDTAPEAICKAALLAVMDA